MRYSFSLIRSFPPTDCRSDADPGARQEEIRTWKAWIFGWRTPIDPFTRLILGTAALGAIALTFAAIELRRDNAAWEARKGSPPPSTSSPESPHGRALSVPSPTQAPPGADGTHLN